mgnify:CR=1 FL=1
MTGVQTCALPIYGVTVGDHAVVGAGAVVRSSVPDYGISVGIPAKVKIGRASGRERV